MRRLSPLLAALQAGSIAREHWMKLTPEDRTQLRTLVTKSKGQPKNLSVAERNEVKRIVGEFDAKGAAWKLAPVGKKLGSGRRR